VDTAGLRDSTDEVEQIGVQRAWDEIYKADLVLFLHDLSRWHSTSSTEQENYQQADLAIAKQLENALTTNVAVVHVWNKLDSIETTQAVQGQHDLILAQQWETLVSHVSEQRQSDASKQHHLMLSAKTGQGLELLRQKLLQLAGWQNNGEGLFLARERHVQALAQVDLHLELAGIHLTELGQLDLAAEELRLCQNALGQITGELTADDLLGHIFTSFCIGK
jgi:tRNA modification GTPase